MAAQKKRAEQKEQQKLIEKIAAKLPNIKISCQHGFPTTTENVIVHTLSILI